MRNPLHSTRALLAAFAALGAFVSFSTAQTVATQPVGAVSLALKRNSDSIIAVPLQPAADFKGSVNSISNVGGNWVLNIVGTPNWNVNQYQGFYYVRVTSGAKVGMFYGVSANTGSSLTLNSSGDDLSSVINGDKVSIYRYWTLGTLFPHNDASRNPLTVSASTLVNARRSQIIIPDNTFQGINLPAQGTYYFTSTGWKRAVAGNPDANDTLLLPDEFFIVRQPATVTSDTTLTFLGSVNMDAFAITLGTRSGGTRDNAVALMRPADVSLADSGLQSGFTSSASTLVNARRDQLLVFDNSIEGLNKSAVRTYYRVGSNWIRATAGNPIANSDILTLGSGFIVRKYQDSNSLTSVAINNPNY